MKTAFSTGKEVDIELSGTSSLLQYSKGLLIGNSCMSLAWQIHRC